MPDQKRNKSEHDDAAAAYGLENTEKLRAFVREELRQAIKEGAIDKEMAQHYDVRRLSR